MGSGIGHWLLFRAADRSLCLFSLVVPPGAMTPVHDHLAWGLVGVYRGTQDEELYERGDGRPRPATTSRGASPASTGAPRTRSSTSPATAASGVCGSGRFSPATTTRCSR